MGRSSYRTVLPQILVRGTWTVFIAMVACPTRFMMALSGKSLIATP